jgi:hypothetical protein
VQPAAQADDKARQVEFFEQRIRPVLVQHCYECHSAGAKELQANLQLDTQAGVLRGGDSGPAVVPGKPEESLLLNALRQQDFKMPPRGKLPDAVIADFETWIRRGAIDPRTEPAGTAARGIDIEQGRQYWAFQPLKIVSPPPVRDTAWPQSEVDRFILAELERQGVRPAADAERRVLIRRAYYALVGLPPPPQAVEAFMADDSPDAWRRVIEGLLSSPQFGERWGRHWLDVARYADSSGGGRALLYVNAWRYRDYVIAAFNDDKPFDQFMVEQVAGDLLPYDSPRQRRDQLTAVGFLVLGPTNYEEQDKERLRMDVVDEQIDTVGRAFLGLTLGCARCHDHKFDPIPTRDYYALAGIFRSTKTLTPGNVSGYVQRELPVSPEHAAALAAHHQKLAPLVAALKEAQGEQKKLAGMLAGAASEALAGIVVDDTQAKTVGVWKSSTYTPKFVGASYLHDEAKGKGEKSITYTPDLPAAGIYEVRISYTPGTNRSPDALVSVRYADGEQDLRIDQRGAPPIDGMFHALGRFKFEAGTSGSVTISNQDTQGHVIADAVQFIPADVLEGAKASGSSKQSALGAGRDAPGAGSGSSSAAPDGRLRAKLGEAEARIKELEAALKELEQQAPPPPPLTMAVVDEPEVGDYSICIRGNVHNLGEKVPRGFVSVLAPRGENVARISPGHSGRLELARWLADPKNPLPARVIVNRVWRQLFGQGLVRTVDNFGATGELPSHPALLDWLAARFTDQGWSIKSLIRDLMCSRVYQLSSGGDPRSAAADPQNRLLGRMSRRRLEAEALRDAILSFSGQLDLTPGGLTFPETLQSEFGFPFKSTRRSVYVPVFRNNLLDLHEVFDVADPNLSIGDRNTSTLPTQALYLMNSPFVLEQARYAAERLLAEQDLDDAGRIKLAYQRALSRGPTERELALAGKYLAQATAAQPERGSDAHLEAWTRFCQALIACADFRYVE